MTSIHSRGRSPIHSSADRSPPDPELIAASRRALAPASRLLAAAGPGTPLLSVVTDPKRRSKTGIFFWSDRFEIRAAPDYRGPGLADLRSAALALKRAGAEIGALLARRWPPNAVPQTIGVISDGVGMAVSGDHPSALTREWFTDHALARAPVFIILPFDAAGLAAFNLHEAGRLN